MTAHRVSDPALEALLRDGNRAYLKHLAAKGALTSTQIAALTARSHGVAVPRGVWVPLIFRADRDGWPGVLARVEVRAVDGAEDRFPRGVSQGTPAAAALTQALNDAWAAAGMEGALRPSVEVRCALADALEVEIDGPSMHLGVFLSALAWWSGDGLPRRVIASGSPQESLGVRAEKCRLIELEAKTFDQASVYFLGPPEQHTVGGRETWRARPEEVAVQLWGVVPWRPGAPGIRRVQVTTRDDDQWPGATHVRLPARVDPSAGLDDYARDVRRALSELPRPARIELRARVPLALAARLGHETVVDALRIVSLDGDLTWRVRHLKTREGEPHTEVRQALDTAQAYEGRQGRFLLLARSADTVMHPWVTWPYLVGQHPLTTESLVALVQQVAATLQGLNDVHLAIEGPVVLAWALGDYLRNKVRVCYWQRDNQTGRYVPWFEG